MEFLKPNYFDTTASLLVSTGTDTALYLIDRDPRFQYITVGNTGATVASIRINFAETMTVSRIALVNHNLKSFKAYYNGITANAFALTGDTTSSDYSQNSNTSHYLTATPVACTSVSLDLRDTIVAGQERAIGYLVVSDILLNIDRVPSSKGYKPLITPTNVIHKLSDGGTRIQTVGDKASAQMSWNYLTTVQRDSLKALYDLHQEMIFCPFGTATGWDAVIFPAVWDGPFEFYNFSDDMATAGFSGKMMVRETPS